MSKSKTQSITTFDVEELETLPPRVKEGNDKLDFVRDLVEKVAETQKTFKVKTSENADKKRKEMNVFKYSFRVARKMLGSKADNVHCEKRNNELYVFYEETEDEETTQEE